MTHSSGRQTGAGMQLRWKQARGAPRGLGLNANRKAVPGPEGPPANWAWCPQGSPGACYFWTGHVMSKVPVGLDRVRASFQAGVSQGTRLSGPREEPWGGVPKQASPPAPRPLQGLCMTEGSREKGGTDLPPPPTRTVQAAHAAAGSDDLSKASTAGCRILQAWTFWGLDSEEEKGFPGLGGMCFLPLWDSDLDPAAVHKSALGLG